MKSENKNVLLFVVCTMLVFLSLEYLFPRSGSNAPMVSQNEVVSAPLTDKVDDLLPNTAQGGVIQIESDTLKGQLHLQGLVLDNLTLLKYKQTVAKDSPDVVLLNADYFTFPVFQSSNTQVPDLNTVWQADSTTLTAESSVTLTWTNDQGVVFTRQISLDDKYMFTINDTVQGGNTPVDISMGGVIKRINPQMEGATSVHQGFVGVLDKKLQEEKYDAIQKNQQFSYDANSGWFGFGDKYWLSALAFIDEKGTAQASFSEKAENKMYTLSYRSHMISVPAHQSITEKTYFFAGPKDLDLLDAYQETLGIERFELAIDFGWYYFLTKPFLRLLSWLYGLVGNMGIAILIFATALRLLMLPIASQSFESMAKMRKVQPRIQELQKRYKDDKVRLNQELLLLYKQEKISPAAGCLPMFIQIPVFFSLYKVLSVSIEMRQAPFFGWIHDLSARDPSSVLTVFGLLPWPIPSMLNIGVWPVLMGITMYLQQKMSAPATGNNQSSDMASAMRWMPLIFTFMMGNFASGLVIYWTWSNILGIIQQRYIMHKYEVKK